MHVHVLNCFSNTHVHCKYYYLQEKNSESTILAACAEERRSGSVNGQFHRANETEHEYQQLHGYSPAERRSGGGGEGGYV